MLFKGDTIGNFQAISFMLAEMATEIEAARQLVYHTALVTAVHIKPSRFMGDMVL